MSVIACSLALRRTLKHLHSATVAQNWEDLRDGLLGQISSREEVQRGIQTQATLLVTYFIHLLIHFKFKGLFLRRVSTHGPSVLPSSIKSCGCLRTDKFTLNFFPQVVSTARFTLGTWC